MFQKKQMIYSETLGICRVENIVQLTASRGDTPTDYYALKPISGRQQAAYIPVKNHTQVLRELFTKEEAALLIKEPETEKNPILKSALEYVLKEQ